MLSRERFCIELDGVIKSDEDLVSFGELSVVVHTLTAQFEQFTWRIGNWCDLSIKSDLVNSYLGYVRAGTAALIHILGIGPELYLLQQLNLILVGVLTFLYNVQCLHQSMQLLRTGWGLWCGG